MAEAVQKTEEGVEKGTAIRPERPERAEDVVFAIVRKPAGRVLVTVRVAVAVAVVVVAVVMGPAAVAAAAAVAVVVVAGVAVTAAKVEVRMPVEKNIVTSKLTNDFCTRVETCS